MTNLFRIVSVIFISGTWLTGFAYGNTDDPTTMLSCTYTFSNDATKKSWVINSTFTINTEDQTVRSTTGTEFLLTATDTLFSFANHRTNNNTVVNINKVTGKLDGFWIINDNEYIMRGECKRKILFSRTN